MPDKITWFKVYSKLIYANLMTDETDIRQEFMAVFIRMRKILFDLRTQRFFTQC